MSCVITNRSFASVWKAAKVSPLHKAGSVDIASNFWPISIIPTVGKILERIIHKQTVAYLESSNILSEAQSGFRAGRSTGTCLIDFLNNIYQGVDGGSVCGVVSLDLAKAFDTVDHKILVDKLQALGFRYGAKTWFQSYLSDRCQQTIVEGHLSSPKQINCGVPQGSILGPLLFICYINDLVNHCHFCKPYLYADDSALCYVDPDPKTVDICLQADLDRLSSWFKVNKLSVNCSKTNCILFTSQRSSQKNYQMSLKLNGEALKQVSNIKYLGLLLDQHLTFDSHVTKLCGKIASRTSLMWRIRSFIPRSLALNLYKSLVYPHFSYCSFILDGISETLKNKLQCYQNAALRAVMNVDMTYSSTRMLAELKIDNVRTEMKKATCKMVYKCFYDLGPTTVNDLFVLYVPERTLRSGDELKVKMHFCRTAFGQKNITFRGSVYWNSLPLALKSCESADSFKRSIKTYSGFD